MNYQSLFQFEQDLARYTGAPYVVVTDGCTHGIELCLRLFNPTRVQFTAFTYLSVPQTMCLLGINFDLTDETWQGEYQLHGTNIWDSARRLQRNMYRDGQIQVLSFGHTKPLDLGARCGAILLDDRTAYLELSRMRSDGRDLHTHPWQDQIEFGPGFHYCPTLESCVQGSQRLRNLTPQCQAVAYPDCRKLRFKV